MKIITSYPIYVNNDELFNDMYLNLDASSPKSDILDFQAWAVGQGYDLSYIKNGKKVVGVDGKWGDKTAKAYAQGGKEWEKTRPSTSTITTANITPDNISNSVVEDANKLKEEEEKNKKKKLINTLLIIGGGVLVLGIFIFLARKRTNITNKRIYIRKK